MVEELVGEGHGSACELLLLVRVSGTAAIFADGSELLLVQDRASTTASRGPQCRWGPADVGARPGALARLVRRESRARRGDRGKAASSGRWVFFLGWLLEKPKI